MVLLPPCASYDKNIHILAIEAEVDNGKKFPILSWDQQFNCLDYRGRDGEGGKGSDCMWPWK